MKKKQITMGFFIIVCLFGLGMERNAFAKEENADVAIEQRADSKTPLLLSKKDEYVFDYETLKKADPDCKEISLPGFSWLDDYSKKGGSISYTVKNELVSKSPKRSLIDYRNKKPSRSAKPFAPKIQLNDLTIGKNIVTLMIENGDVEKNRSQKEVVVYLNRESEFTAGLKKKHNELVGDGYKLSKYYQKAYQNYTTGSDKKAFQYFFGGYYHLGINPGTGSQNILVANAELLDPIVPHLYDSNGNLWSSKGLRLINNGEILEPVAKTAVDEYWIKKEGADIKGMVYVKDAIPGVLLTFKMNSTSQGAIECTTSMINYTGNFMDKVGLFYSVDTYLGTDDTVTIKSIGNKEGMYMDNETASFMYSFLPPESGGPQNFNAGRYSDLATLLPFNGKYDGAGGEVDRGLHTDASMYDGIQDSGLAFKKWKSFLAPGEELSMSWFLGMRVEHKYPEIYVDNDNNTFFTGQQNKLSGVWIDRFSVAGGKVTYRVMETGATGQLLTYKNPNPNRKRHPWTAEIPEEHLRKGNNTVKITIDNGQTPTNIATTTCSVFLADGIEQQARFRKVGTSEYQTDIMLPANTATMFDVKNNFSIPNSTTNSHEYLVTYQLPEPLKYVSGTLRLNGAKVPAEDVVSQGDTEVKFYLPPFTAPGDTKQAITLQTKLPDSYDTTKFPLTTQFLVTNKAGSLNSLSNKLTLDVQKKGTVTFKYQDEDGNKIHEDVSVTDDIGTPYNPDNMHQLVIKDYQFMSADGDLDGVFATEPKTIILTYHYLGNRIISSAPTTLVFGKIDLADSQKLTGLNPSDLSSINRPLIVSDTLTTWKKWELTVSVVTELTGDGEVLHDSLKYVRKLPGTEQETITLNNQPQTIFAQTDANKNKQDFNISDEWGLDKDQLGLKVQVNKGTIPKVETAYQGTLKWILRDVKE